MNLSARLHNTVLFALWVVGLGACAGNATSREPSAPGAKGIRGLLSREAYLLALDASLPRVRPGATRIQIYPADSLPFTREDLASRNVQRGWTKWLACQGDAALTFGAPRREADEQIRLEVVEVSIPRGYAIGHIYYFRCASGTCRAEYDTALDEDSILTCGPGVEFGRSQPRSNPLMQPTTADGGGSLLRRLSDGEL